MSFFFFFHRNYSFNFLFLAGIPKGAILTHYGMVSTAMAGLQHIVSWILFENGIMIDRSFV